MLLSVVFLILGAAIGFYIAKLVDKDGFCGVSIGIAVGLVLIIVAYLLTDPYLEPVWQTQESPLVAMRTSESFEGTFVFASGDWSTERIYRYYIVTPDGGYQAQSINAEEGSVVVFEDMPEGTGKLIRKKWRDEPPDNWGKFLNILLVIDWSDYEYQFHIPEGSLVQEFHLE